jgi:hypothetical protein
MGSLKIQEAFWFLDNMPSIYLFLKEKLMVVSFKILFMGVINMIMDKLEDFGGLTNAISDATRGRSNRKTRVKHECFF